MKKILVKMMLYALLMLIPVAIVGFPMLLVLSVFLKWGSGATISLGLLVVVELLSLAWFLISLADDFE